MEDILKLKIIDDKVKKILCDCNINTPPIDVRKICEKYKLIIQQYDFSEAEKKANGKQISGALVRNAGQSKGNIILTNIKEVPARQRFTIAHELGHYFIEEPNEEISVSFRGWYDDKERKADEFAAKLLMPSDMIYKEHKNAIYPTISYLADIFEVSKQAMYRRLKELELDYIEL